MTKMWDKTCQQWYHVYTVKAQAVCQITQVVWLVQCTHGIGHLNEWYINMAMRHTQQTAHVLLLSMFISTQRAYWVNSCIICPFFICETTDRLTLAQSLVTVGWCCFDHMHGYFTHTHTYI